MKLRADAHRILQAALAAVNPRGAIHRALSLEGQSLRIGNDTLSLDTVDRVLLLAAGKAAVGMSQAALDVLGSRVEKGMMVIPHTHDPPILPVETLKAGHPVPDEHGVRAASAALQLAKEAGERDLVLCLLSGGASALWTAPVEGVSLSDLQDVTGRLLRTGATIGDLNSVRKHLSRIAGGRLALAAAPARTVTLIISDVVGSPLDVIASGPTVPDHTTYAYALNILERHETTAPASVLSVLRAGAAGKLPETPKPGDPRLDSSKAHVIASMQDALDGAACEARRLGYTPLVLTGRVEGEAREVGRLTAGLAVGVRDDGQPLPAPAALLLGGETTVTVRGTGKGGRNQELALAAAVALEGQDGVLVASMGTDGVDGPTDAAGAVVDGLTVSRGRASGLTAREHLTSNDSYSFLQATEDLLLIGPTGTNVGDVVVVLAA